MRGTSSLGDGLSRNKNQFFVIVTFLAFISLGYYCLTYSWENQDILQKYEKSNWQLIDMTNKFTASENKLEEAIQNIKSTRISNNDLHAQNSQMLIENDKLQREKSLLSDKVVKASSFHVGVKKILGILDDPKFKDVNGDVSESTYNALQTAIQDKLNELSNCKQEIEDRKAENLKQTQNIKQLQEEISMMNKENHRLKQEKQERGLKSSQNNVRSNAKMEILDKRVQEAVNNVVPINNGKLHNTEITNGTAVTFLDVITTNKSNLPSVAPTSTSFSDIVSTQKLEEDEVHKVNGISEEPTVDNHEVKESNDKSDTEDGEEDENIKA